MFLSIRFEYFFLQRKLKIGFWRESHAKLKPILNGGFSICLSWRVMCAFADVICLRVFGRYVGIWEAFSWNSDGCVYF
jgi:hypothetical protein